MPRAIAAVLCGAVMALAACDIDPVSLVTMPGERDAQTPFRDLPLKRAWVNAPGAIFVMERELVNGAEQRIGLRNTTSAAGDNVIVMRTRQMWGATGRFRFEEFTRRIGGLPPPFTDLKTGDLRAEEDELGSYLWAETTKGNAVCVLGLRRLTTSDRQLPAGAAAMDVMLRNCVHGTAEEALAPLRDGATAVGPRAGAGGGKSRMISPLAAPLIE